MGLSMCPYLAIFCLVICFGIGSTQQINPGQLVNIRLCAAGFKQFYLCERLQQELILDETLQEGTIPFYVNLIGASQSKFAGRLTCIAANHSMECAELISKDQADLARYNSEELYGLSKIAEYSNLAVINAGKTTSNCPPSSECHQYAREYSVAVVMKRSGIRRLSDLRDRKACFGEVGSTAGWTIPIFKLRANWTRNSPNIRPIITRKRRHVMEPIIARRLKRQIRPIYANVTNTEPANNQGRYGAADNGVAQCPLDLNIANDVFPSSCAPGIWATQDSFGKIYSQRLCANCVGRNQSCTSREPANNAMTCLRNGKGDVAFVSSTQVLNIFKEYEDTEDYALLCASGLRDVFEYNFCHWGVIPADGYIVFNGKNSGRQHPAQVFGEYMHQLYSKAGTDYYPEEVRDFLSGNGKEVVNLVRLDIHYGQNDAPGAVPTPQTYLQREGGEEFYASMQGSFPTCNNKDKMRLCVLSNTELEKCNQMKMAFRAASMPESLDCMLGYSEFDCANKVNQSIADIAMMSAHRADQVLHEQKIKPLFVESYGNSEPVYAIAVSLSDTKSVQNLDGLDSGLINVCSAGTDSFAGWEAPNRAFKNLKMIQNSDCQLTEAWARMFRGGCVPGARNASVTLGRNASTPIDTNSGNHLCQGCSTGSWNCLTPPEAKGSPSNYDPYYGDIGALRCLVRRKGDVAFLRSTALQTMMTLKEMGDKDFRSLNPSNFVILCPDGQTKQTYSSQTLVNCNLGRIPNRWMVARANADSAQLQRWQDLWLVAYNRARISYDWLRTYVRQTDNILDLIFTNTTEKLHRFPIESVSEHYFDEFAYEHWNSPFECSGGSGKFSCFSFTVIVTLCCYLGRSVF